MWRQSWICLTVLTLSGFCVAGRKMEVCPSVCEPEKCPNVGPITVSECPATHIVPYRCGCCKRCDLPFVTTTLSPSRRDEVCKEFNCPKKKLCVLNMQGLPVCRCPSGDLCTKIVRRKLFRKPKKVCGTDGVTYLSRCHLKVASCNNDKKIRVRHRGECMKTRQPYVIATSTTTVRPPVTERRNALNNWLERLDEKDVRHRWRQGRLNRKQKQRKGRRLTKRLQRRLKKERSSSE